MRDLRRVKRNGHIFCSPKCSREFHVAVNNSNWRGGGDSGRGKGWSRLAEKIRARDGFSCRWCGKSQEQNRRRLSVDHVRPWREFEVEQEANDPANLVSLCQSCHGKKLGLENKWLRGDGLALQEYRRFVGIASISRTLDTPLDSSAKRLRRAPNKPPKRGPCPAVSAAKRKYYARPGIKEEWTTRNRARVTPEWREKVSRRTKEAMNDPVIKKRHLDAVRASRQRERTK